MTERSPDIVLVLQKLQRFVVTFALKKVGELRINGFWQRGGEIVDLF